ncbi:MAG: hypothetical protein U9R34_01295 [Nanoarchaeota archaeon]|nr:hypothetical protein [Nanoarchaeota archaeon]
MKKYPKQELIQNLRQLSKDLSRLPKQRDLIKPSLMAYRNTFGSFNKALSEAGLEPLKRISYTKTELLELLRKRYSQTNKIPTQRDFNKLKNYPDSKTYYERFGSWNRALETAGLKLNKAGSKKGKKPKKVIEPKKIIKKEEPQKKPFWKRIFRRESN